MEAANLYNVCGDALTLLAIEGVAKAYAGVAALTSATFDLRAGEIHALVGENGAGKSSLIRILAGVTAAEHGLIRLSGAPVTIASPADAHRRGLRFVHQELSIVPQLSVAENLFLGRDYPRRLGMFVDWEALHSASRSALAALSISRIDPRTKMARLLPGDRLLVYLARAFISDGQGSPPRIYVLDEPTAALSTEESVRLFRVLAELKTQGCGILYVTHRLDEVMRLCDRVTVLRDGATQATLAIAQTSKAGIIEQMIGRAQAEAYPRRRQPVDSEIALTVDGLGSSGFCCALRKGEILGLAGLQGAGQSDILRWLMGDGAASGSISLGGDPRRNRHPADAWRQGFAHVPRERRSEGLILGLSVAANATLPHLQLFRRLGLLLDGKAERARLTQLGAQVRLKSTGPHQTVRQLSGGNQQKVLFARAIGGKPAVLLLDEPTRGVDIGARFEIYALLRELTDTGLSVILTSSDLGELIGLADRVLVLQGGRVVAERSTEGLNPQDLLALCNGGPGKSEPTQARP